jgi:hypothetical protein
LGERYRSLSSSLCNFLHSLLLQPSQAQIFSSAPYSQTTSAYAPPSISVTNFHTQTNRQNYSSFYLNHKFFDNKLEDRRFCTYRMTASIAWLQWELYYKCFK